MQARPHPSDSAGVGLDAGSARPVAVMENGRSSAAAGARGHHRPAPVKTAAGALGSRQQGFIAAVKESFGFISCALPACRVPAAAPAFARAAARGRAHAASLGAAMRPYSVVTGVRGHWRRGPRVRGGPAVA